MIDLIIGFIVGVIVGYLCRGTVKDWITALKGWLTKTPPA